jgi:hypothetical protein
MYQNVKDHMSLSLFPLIDDAKIGIKKIPARIKKRVGKVLGNKRKNWGIKERIGENHPFL